MQKPPLGELQLEILRFISDRGPLSVGEVAALFGEPRGLARTTILIVSVLVLPLNLDVGSVAHRGNGTYRQRARVRGPT